MSPRNHTDCVGNDCDAVLSGEIVAGRYVQLAVERHLDDLEHAHQRGLHFDAEIAGKSLRFVEAVCTHQKAEWAGQPLLLSPNQQFILWNLTGGLTGAGVFGGHTSRRGHFRSLLTLIAVCVFGQSVHAEISLQVCDVNLQLCQLT